MIKNTKGAIFITVIVISMLMVLIGVSASNMLLQDVHMVRHLKKSTTAQYIAEAGINDGLATLVQNGFMAKDTYFPLVDNTFGGGGYNVTVTESGGRVLLTSVGAFDGISRTVAVEVKDNTATALFYMMAAGTDLRLRAFFLGLADVNGDLHANNDVRLRAQAIALIDVDPCGYGCCDGSVSAVNRVFQSTGWGGSIQIAGSVTQGSDVGVDVAPVLFPQFNYAYYQTQAIASGDYYNGDTTFGSVGTTTNLTPGNGIVYVNGTATLQGTVNLNGGIVADKILIRGRLNQIKTGNKNVVIAKGSDDGSTQGDIYIYYRLEVEEAVVYAVRDFRVVAAFSRVTVTGSLLAARNIRIWDLLSHITYNHKLLSPDGLLGPGGEEEPFRVVSWNR
ncbi:MAG: pilus assembly PilX N-terminal domain-containing protein [Candidatus Omnitrophica bacterium]|nr:pilus assembly PilX N-terminal domain-containing protein [Candidatus Omnitrophota bacterium]